MIHVSRRKWGKGFSNFNNFVDATIQGLEECIKKEQRILFITEASNNNVILHGSHLLLDFLVDSFFLYIFALSSFFCLTSMIGYYLCCCHLAPLHCVFTRNLVRIRCCNPYFLSYSLLGWKTIWIVHLCAYC